MKKIVYAFLMMMSVASFGQTLEDFPWLSQIINSDDCCEVQSAVAYPVNNNYFIYVSPDFQCSGEFGKLYYENGDCWCISSGTLDCVAFYGFSDMNAISLYDCTPDNNNNNGDSGIFDEYTWLNNQVDTTNCCTDQSVEIHSFGNYSFIYVDDCTGELGTMYAEDGQLWCTDYPGFDCSSFYGLSENSLYATWNCVASDCVELTWYQDADGDGLGNPQVSQLSCEQPAGYVSNSSDTDDTCNGTLDACGVCNGSGMSTWCQDADGDGLGNPAVTTMSCEQPTGYVANCSDTDDGCDGTVDACGVCNGPGMSTWCQDLDGDGLGNPDVSIMSCEQPSGYVADCSDTNDNCNGVVDVCGICNGSGMSTWCQDLDGDGLGNPDVSIMSCDQPEGYVADCSDTDDGGTSNGLHPAFSEFDPGSYTIYLDGDDVVIESDGLPNHTSPYWSNTTERCRIGPMGNLMCTNSNTTENHPLFVEPTATTYDDMAPGNIDDFNGSYTLRVPISPALASSPTSTGLGPIGMAVSGSMIYNDQEGPNVPLDNAVVSFDYTAAHTGPQSYHYHLEPKAWSDDDDKLIGIMADGFFLYGRKNSDGTYPTDLDESGGHFGPTPHNPDGEYHYHIKNELYLNEYYILFSGDYQGTPNNIQ